MGMIDNSTELYIGWKNPPEGRGTLDIVYSSLFIVFICTWSALHSNVPADDDSPSRVFWRKVTWMLIGILAPEFIAYIALGEYFEARGIQKLIGEEKHCEQYRSWWTIRHSFLVVMGGISLATSEGERYRPQKKQFPELLKEGKLGMPLIPEKEIKDKSKADWVVKSIACVQILWFLLQTVGRAVQHLPTTTLELFTMAIIYCTLFTYSAWWYKPKDVEVPFVASTTCSFEELEDGSGEAPGKRASLTDAAAFESSDGAITVWTLLNLIATAGFGAMHVVAWNFHFPTPVERLLWRITSLACFLLSLLYFGMARIVVRYGPIDVWKIGFSVALFIYFLVRLYLLVEVFVSLRSVPVGLYEVVNWGAYLPHI